MIRHRTAVAPSLALAAPAPRHEFLLRIWDRFHAEGIEIPFPQRDVHIRTTVEKTS